MQDMGLLPALCRVYHANIMQTQWHSLPPALQYMQSLFIRASPKHFLACEAATMLSWKQHAHVGRKPVLTRNGPHMLYTKATVWQEKCLSAPTSEAVSQQATQDVLRVVVGDCYQKELAAGG